MYSKVTGQQNINEKRLFSRSILQNIGILKYLNFSKTSEREVFEKRFKLKIRLIFVK